MAKIKHLPLRTPFSKETEFVSLCSEGTEVWTVNFQPLVKYSATGSADTGGIVNTCASR